MAEQVKGWAILHGRSYAPSISKCERVAFTKFGTYLHTHKHTLMHLHVLFVHIALYVAGLNTPRAFILSSSVRQMKKARFELLSSAQLSSD